MYRIRCSLVLLSLVQFISADTYGKVISVGGVDLTSLSVRVSKSKGMCAYMVSGRGVKDTLPEKCHGDGVTISPNIINSERYSAVYYPNNIPFALYTDSYGTMAILKPEGCTWRKYNAGPSPVETPLSAEVCDKIKAELADQIVKIQEYWRKWSINFHRKMKGLPPAEIIFDPLQNQPLTPSLYAGESKSPSSASSGSSIDGSSVEDSQAEMAPQQPIAPSKTDPLEPFKVTYPFKLDDRGKDAKSYDISVSTNIDSFNVKGCWYYIRCKGFGINAQFQVACNKENSKAVAMRDFMSYGTPASTFALFSEKPKSNQLVILIKGKCYKRTFGDNPTGPTLMEAEECENTKRRMNERFLRPNGEDLPVNATGDKTSDTSEVRPSDSTASSVSSTEAEPEITWNSGSFLSTYSPKLSITINKNKDESGSCTVEVKIVGRGINERMKKSCSLLGENLVRKSTLTSLAIGDPSTNSGFYSENWSGLVVVVNGRCTYRSYKSSPITNRTKSTPRAMSAAECDVARKRLSAALKRK